MSAAPIASGRTADLYAAPDGRVVKLLRAGFDASILETEAARTATVRAAGIPAPGVGERVEVDGRPGVLFERIDGPTMLGAILSDLERSDEFVVAFASLHVDLLNASADDGLPDVKDVVADKIDRADLPLPQRTRAKDHLATLSDGASTLHGDFHPGNILLARNGPVIIDWGDASSGAAAADIARTLLLLTPESAAGVVPDPSGVAAHVVQFADAYLQRCVQATATTVAEVTAWRLPVVAARLSEGIPAQTEMLQAEVGRLASDPSG